MARNGFACEVKIVNDAHFDAAAKHYAMKLRLPATYLHFVDQAGILTIRTFNTDVKIQDQACDETLKELPAKLRENAECITGTDVSVRPPGEG